MAQICQPGAVLSKLNQFGLSVGGKLRLILELLQVRLYRCHAAKRSQLGLFGGYLGTNPVGLGLPADLEVSRGAVQFHMPAFQVI